MHPDVGRSRSTMSWTLDAIHCCHGCCNAHVFARLNCRNSRSLYLNPARSTSSSSTDTSATVVRLGMWEGNNTQYSSRNAVSLACRFAYLFTLLVILPGTMADWVSKGAPRFFPDPAKVAAFPAQLDSQRNVRETGVKEVLSSTLRALCAGCRTGC